MHKFSELVKFRNDLAASVEHLQLDSAVNEKIVELTNIKKLNPNLNYNTQIDSYIREFSQLIDVNHQTINKIKTTISDITLDIDCLAKTLFDTDEQRDTFKNNNIYQLLELNEEQNNYVSNRIGSYCDWLYPSLIIYPREKKWLLSTIVASDPLYLVQHNSIKLRSLTKDFSEVYQNRLRYYDINNKFSLLPEKQFGFVLLWDFLNYISVDQFEFYLREIFNLIKPGGSFMFSYNNCDLEGPARIAELIGSSYANARIIETLSKQIGFETIKFEDLPTGDKTITHISWVELRKPGTLSTVKAHQALARIIEK
jgi:SAM-dependent methyltransferase